VLGAAWDYCAGAVLIRIVSSAQDVVTIEKIITVAMNIITITIYE
jgi:hypothetical protein